MIRTMVKVLLGGAALVMVLPAMAQEAFDEDVVDGIVVSRFDDMTRPGEVRFEQILEAFDEVGQPYVVIDADVRDAAQAARIADDLNALALLDGFEKSGGALRMRVTWGTRAAQLLLADTSATADDIAEEVLVLTENIPPTFVADYMRGNVLYVLSDQENALIALELAYNSLPRGLETESEALQLFVTYALLLNNFGEYRQTLEVIGFAIELDPDFAHAYFVKARALRFLGRIEEAQANLERAIELRDRAVYRNELGRLYITTEEFDLAEEQFRLALEFSPNNAVALAGLGDVAYFSGDIRGSIPFFEDAAAADPTYAYAFYALAFSHFDLDNYRAALQAVDEALAIDPEYLDAVRLRADILFAQGDEREAADEYQRYLDLGGEMQEYIRERLR